MSEKTMAVAAIMWLISSVYFSCLAIKGDYPAYFGVVTASGITVFSMALVYLLRIVFK